MTASSRISLRFAAVFCGLYGIYGVLYFVLTLLDGPYNLLFPDFLVFHAAVRAFFEGKLALVYDIDAFTGFQNALYVDRFPKPIHFRPFFYPPIWLLMLLPLGWLAVAKAYGVFMAATAAAATLVEGRRDWWGWLAIVTSPAAMWTALSGQNTFLSLALFYGGFRLIERAPVAAGILLGLLSYKPQIWLLVPLALFAARQWKVLAWTIATVAILSLTSLGVFGLDFWLAFFDAAREAGSARVIDETFERIFMHMTTLLAAARILGLPPVVAGAIQLAGAVLAIAAVWFAFRRRGTSDARTAVLVTATFLVSPYTLNYDLLLLMPAAVALFRRGAAEGFYPLERLVYLALWLIPTFGMVLNRLDLPVMPPVILLFGAIAWARLWSAPRGELPSAATAR
ncbi:MAG: glycosyltransferase family 87 protein [Reyranellales bacterium]